MYFIFYVCKCCNHLLNLLIVAFDNYLTENFGEIMMADADFNTNTIHQLLTIAQTIASYEYSCIIVKNVLMTINKNVIYITSIAP